MNAMPTRTPTRRSVVVGALWATPAVLIATAVPAAANSVEPQAPTAQWVNSVRADGPAWQSYTAANEMPGFRFGTSVTGPVTLVITKTGPTATASEVLYPYDSMVFTGNSNSFVTATTLNAGNTKGVTIKNTPNAVGAYTALVYFPASESTVVASASLTIYQATPGGQLRVSTP